MPIVSKSFHVFTTKKTKVKKIAQYLEIHGKKINNNNNNNNINNNKEKLTWKQKNLNQHLQMVNGIRD